MTPQWLYWPTAAGGGVSAVGGTETDSGGYRYHTFTGSGSLVVSTGGSVEYLVVGGGGGGGRGNGRSGGGAGGFLSGTATLSADTYSITVGAGGADRTTTNGPGNDGGNSELNGAGLVVTAYGGGGGAGTNQANGRPGGSGGGASWGPSTVGGSGIAGQGNAGASGPHGTANGGGGGGGASQAGQSMPPNLAGGNGGDGAEWPSGSGDYYAGGGGGGAGSNPPIQGAGGLGGGAGASSSAAIANTGGGGGGKPDDTFNCAGGSGIVIVRYQIGGAVLWTPAELGSLVGWWKADSITGLSDGDAVLVWPDSSSDSRDAAGVNAPVYRVSTANGLPGVEFNDASSHGMTVSKTAGVFNDISGGTIAAVRKWGKTPTSFAYEVLITIADHVSSQRFAILAWTSGRSATGPRRLDTDSPSWLATGSLVNTGSTDIQISVANFSSASVDMYRNGTADGGSPSWQGSGNTSATDPGIIRIGARTDSANTFHGVMNEIVITNNALGAPDRQKLEGYLAHKWGLEWNLPAGHPYKTSPPYKDTP